MAKKKAVAEPVKLVKPEREIYYYLHRVDEGGPSIVGVVYYDNDGIELVLNDNITLREHSGHPLRLVPHEEHCSPEV